MSIPRGCHSVPSRLCSLCEVGIHKEAASKHLISPLSTAQAAVTGVWGWEGLVSRGHGIISLQV